MQKKYVVRLTDEERAELAEVIKKLKGTSQKVRRAQILLKADAEGPNWTDRQIAEAYGCRTKTVENVRQRLVERGFEETLAGAQRERPPVEKLLDGEQEAQVIALRLGAPPKGYANWTLRLLARKVVELEIAESISHETIRRTLKKNGMTNRKIEYWVIPPEADAEFAASMEEVLETYAQPYDPACPVLCMDEQPVQLLKETRTPIPATATHGRRVDYEYERAGTANIFMFTEPLAGWREVAVRQTKTKLDWAHEMARLLEGRYEHCEKVILVSDNLNTHTKGAFYEAFEPERARQLVRRLEFRHTPKHGSWLNIAENELSSVTRQCVSGRRFGDIDALREETSAWSTDVNNTQRGVDWQMKIDDARTKLISIYPKIKK
jgi:transposase